MRAAILCALGILYGYGASPRVPTGGASVRAVVLGIAQDGGVPHIGCRQERCEGARRDPSRRDMRRWQPALAVAEARVDF